MKMPRAVLAMATLLVLGTATGCSSDDSKAGNSNKSCTTLCTEGQAGSCTSVKGDCAAFCSALASATPKASCQADYDAYQGCLKGGSSACDNNCDSQESALTSCVTGYCAAHTTDADCKTLIASF